MKKTLLLVASALFATSMFAETISFAGLTAGDFTEPTANAEMTTYTMDGVDGPAVNYLNGGNEDMSVVVRGVKFVYKNKDAKKNILKSGPAFLQTDGKNVRLVLENVQVGTAITMKVKAKGDTNATFSAEKGAVADDNNPESVDKADFKEFKFTAIEGIVEIKETGGGYRIESLTIGSGDEPGSFVANPIAEQIFFNGSEIMNGQGLSLSVYNTLGKLVLTTSDASVNMNDMTKGIYIVRAEGVKGALKISL